MTTARGNFGIINVDIPRESGIGGVNVDGSNDEIVQCRIRLKNENY